MKAKVVLSSFALALGSWGMSLPAHAQSVDLELALLVDVSGSISTAEFNLQRSGYAQAFQDAAVQAAFASGRSVAVTLIYWSGATQQQVALDWTLVDSAAAANSFAALIEAAPRPFNGGTSIGPAIDFAVPLFGTNSFTSARQVIDVSGDGTSGVTATQAARDDALAEGIDQINGLAIGGVGITNFYANNVIGGTGSFVIGVAGFDDFAGAVTQKLGREVSVIPEPGTYALLLAGLGAIAFRSVSRRRRR